MFICYKKTYFVLKKTFICMKTDSDGCHVDYLYDNWPKGFPWGSGYILLYIPTRVIIQTFSIPKKDTLY